MAEGKIGCPECLPGAKAPHDEADQNHIHLTDYGYLIYAPQHEMADYVEEIRAEGFARGRDAAAGAYQAGYEAAWHAAASDILTAAGRHAFPESRDEQVGGEAGDG